MARIAKRLASREEASRQLNPDDLGEHTHVDKSKRLGAATLDPADSRLGNVGRSSDLSEAQAAILAFGPELPSKLADEAQATLAATVVRALPGRHCAQASVTGIHGGLSVPPGCRQIGGEPLQSAQCWAARVARVSVAGECRRGTRAVE
jgi:hypothetical protein